MTEIQPRKPAGTPTGGEFAGKTGSAPSSALAKTRDRSDAKPDGRFVRNRKGSGIPGVYSFALDHDRHSPHDRRTLDEWIADTDSVRIVDELGSKKREYQSWAYTAAEEAGFEVETVWAADLREGDVVFNKWRPGDPEEMIALGGPAGPSPADGRRAVCFLDHGAAFVADLSFDRRKVQRIRRND